MQDYAASVREFTSSFSSHSSDDGLSAQLEHCPPCPQHWQRNLPNIYPLRGKDDALGGLENSCSRLRKKLPSRIERKVCDSILPKDHKDQPVVDKKYDLKKSFIRKSCLLRRR